MKKIYILLLALMAMTFVWGQNNVAKDIIYTTNYDVIEAKILEVSSTQVKYKEFNNPEGPVFILQTSKIGKICYSNGTEKRFEHPQVAPASPVSPTNPVGAVSPAGADAPMPFAFQMNLDIDGNLAFVNSFSYNGYSFKSYATGGADVTLSLGARMSNWVYFGISSGILGEWGNTKAKKIGDDKYDIPASAAGWAVPIFADIRVYCPTGTNCFPFAEVGVGGYTTIQDRVKFGDETFDRLKEGGAKGGFYLITGAGLEFKFLTIGAGYKLLRNTDGIGNHGYVKIGVSLGAPFKVRM